MTATESARETPAQPDHSHLDSARGWVTACGAAIVVMAGFGTIYSFTAFANDMAEEFDTGLGPISIVFGVTVFLYFGSAVVSGRLYDRFGIVPLLIVGGALFVGGLVATSQVSVLWHGYLLFGFGLGFGGGLFNAPLFALTAMWFAKHRAIATGIVATGSGLGTMIYIPFAQWLLREYGWRAGMRWLAVIAAAILVFGLLVIRQPPRVEMGDPRRHVSLVVRTPAFWQMGFAGILFTIAVIGTIGLLIPFAVDDGVPEIAAGLLGFTVGLSSIVGRLALTSLARPLGSVRLLKIAFMGLPVAYAVWFVSTRVSVLETKYVLLVIFVAVLGVSYGGFVALLADVTAHLFGLAGIGAVVGIFFFFSGTGALIGPPLLGFTRDASGGITTPIAMVGIIALAGVFVLAPLSRRPLELPTYIGPGGVPSRVTAPPPRQVAITATSPSPAAQRPLVPTLAGASPARAHSAPGPQSQPAPVRSPGTAPAPAASAVPTVPSVRPLDNGLVAAMSQPRSAALQDAPPEVFWPVADEAVSANGQS